jgi:hypothetical protein
MTEPLAYVRRSRDIFANKYIDERARAEIAEAQLSAAIAAAEVLKDAVWQVLDDMGKDGRSCCPAAKAQLRVAFEPFLQAEIKDDPSLVGEWEPDYSLEEAVALLKGLNSDVEKEPATEEMVEAGVAAWLEEDTPTLGNEAVVRKIFSAMNAREKKEGLN